MGFIKVKDAMSPKHVGKKVKLRGWVYRSRAGKDVAFITLRDSSGVIQATVKAGPCFEEARKLLIESAVELSGKIKEDKRAPGGYEMAVEDMKVVSHAERFPITKEQSDEFLLDVRHLWVRSMKMTHILKIRSTVFGAIHDYFRGKGFYEAQAPSLTPAACEGGSTLFEVKYYGKKVYLTQSWQLYAEAMLPALEKIYTIAPSFRAEKMKTARHLTEYWHAEVEAAWAGLDDIVRIGEELVSHICQTVAKECAEQLKGLGQDPKALAQIKAPFPRITYEEALRILKEKDRMTVPWGKDLRTLEEKKLTKHYKKPLIVTHYPKEIKAFYMRESPEKPGTVLCYDMLAGDVGEIIGASEREMRLEELISKLKAQHEDLKRYEWYLDTRRFGAVPHAGLGLGVERVIQWICGLGSIKDAIAFPRTMERIYP